MTRYQLLKEKEDTIFQFVKAGVLSYKIIRDMNIYESYLQLETDISFNQIKYLMLSEQYDLSDSSIEQIIYQMQREV